MIEAILVVLSNPLPGREDDFNDWYTHIHVRDSLRFRGSITAQRFRRTAIIQGSEAASARYLALYDTFDAARFSREHFENALTTRMPISDSFDDSHIADFHYYPLQFRDNDPESNSVDGLILEQLSVPEENSSAFREWYEGEYIGKAMKRPGVKSVSFLVYRSYGQIFPMAPQHKFVAIYRVKGEDAAEAWKKDTTLSQSPLLDQSKLLVTSWEKITERLTEDDVQHTTASALAEEERARQRMGNRIVTGGKEKLIAK